jgi:hypothetical protein
MKYLVGHNFSFIKPCFSDFKVSAEIYSLKKRNSNRTCLICHTSIPNSPVFPIVAPHYTTIPILLCTKTQSNKDTDNFLPPVGDEHKHPK